VVERGRHAVTNGGTRDVGILIRSGQCTSLKKGGFSLPCRPFCCSCRASASHPYSSFFSAALHGAGRGGHLVVAPFVLFLPAKGKAGDEHGRLGEVVQPVLVVLRLGGGRAGRGTEDTVEEGYRICVLDKGLEDMAEEQLEGWEGGLMSEKSGGGTVEAAAGRGKDVGRKGRGRVAMVRAGPAQCLSVKGGRAV